MIILVLLMLIYPIVADPNVTHPDEIHSLPGWNETLNFKQYSGYLNVSEDKFLHYWFVESQRKPEADPVILWLNGGPGCSSLDGLMSELGPFHLEPDGKKLYNNTYSWNTVANVIFLETPAGVGYSYSISKNYSANDDMVAEDNYIFLQRFFKLFPQFKKNEFYISGESYGGIYVSTLSVTVLKGSSGINFKGFTIGNGCLGHIHLPKSLIFYAYYHGLIRDSLWESLTRHCCSGIPTKAKCKFHNTRSEECDEAVYSVGKLIFETNLNIYNLYDKCSHSASEISRYNLDKINLLHSISKNYSGPHADHKMIPCLDHAKETAYFNQKSVRDALHIPDSVPQWMLCNRIVTDNYYYSYKTMKPQILELLGSRKLRGLIYNGDADLACNFLGSEWFVSGLNLTTTSDFGAWLYEGQIAGYVTYYENLTSLTVKGGGHMTPQDKPGPALEIITNFLSNKKLKSSVKV